MSHHCAVGGVFGQDPSMQGNDPINAGPQPLGLNTTGRHIGPGTGGVVVGLGVAVAVAVSVGVGVVVGVNVGVLVGGSSK